MKIFGPVQPHVYSYLRMALGFATLIYLAMLWPDRQLWFSNRGFVPPGAAAAWSSGGIVSPLKTLGDPQTVTFVFFLSFLSALFMTFGLFSRVSTAATAFFVASLQLRNAYILDGGDQLLRIMLVYLAFAETGRTHSLDQRFNPRQVTPVARWPLALMQFNIAVMYFVSVLTKLMGPTWRDGTAFGFALSLSEQRRFPVPEFVHHYPWIALATYATLFIEAALCLQVFLPRMRRFVLPFGILLHLGIEYCFNIPIFSITVLASYMAFASEKPST